MGFELKGASREGVKSKGKEEVKRIREKTESEAENKDLQNLSVMNKLVL